MREKIKNIIKKIIQFILNPRLILCIGVGWMITNGWSYIMFGIGMKFDIDWMIAVGGGYLALLWLPMTPEKIVTFLIAIGLLRWWFPNDEKTLGVVFRLLERTKNIVRRRREWFRNLRKRSREKKKKDD